MADVDWTDILHQVDAEIAPEKMSLREAIEELDGLMGELNIRRDAMTEDLKSGMIREYDEKTCITAGELRAAGIPIPEHIPDPGWVPRASIRTGRQSPTMEFKDDGAVQITAGIELTEPFRWIVVEAEIKDPEKPDGT